MTAACLDALDEFRVGYGGLILAGTSEASRLASGTSLVLAEVEGLEGLTTVGDLVPFAVADGGVGTMHRRAPREFVLRAYSAGRSSRERWEDSRAFLRAFARRNRPEGLRYRLPGQPVDLVTFARPLPRIGARTAENGASRPSFEVVMLAPDPRHYGVDENTTTIAVSGASTDAGVDEPIDDAKDVVGFVPRPITNVENEGDDYAPIDLVVYGPAVGTVGGVTVRNETTGTSASFSALLSGNVALRLNTRAYLSPDGSDPVTIDGVNAYSSWSNPEPFMLAPGTNVISAFFAGSGAGRVIIRWRSTYY